MTRPNHPPQAEVSAGAVPQMWSTNAEQPPHAARWKAAEDRLYPLIMVDPELYEAAVTLVCQALDVLRSQCGTIAELSGVDPSEVLRQCPAASDMPLFGLDSAVVIDAARAYRWRDLMTDQTGAEPDAGQNGFR